MKYPGLTQQQASLVQFARKRGRDWLFKNHPEHYQAIVPYLPPL